jgi:hypothetical protein
MNARTSLLFGALLAVSATSHAHHGWSEYDSAKTLNVTGTIRESGYENPPTRPGMWYWHRLLA